MTFQNYSSQPKYEYILQRIFSLRFFLKMTLTRLFGAERNFLEALDTTGSFG